MTKTMAGIVAGFFCLLAYLLGLQMAVAIMAVTATCTAIVVGLILFAFWFGERREDYLIKRAERLEKEYKAKTFVITMGNQGYYGNHQTGKIKSLHLNPSTGNGQKPTPEEVQRWAIFHQPAARAKQTFALPASTETIQDLLPQLDTVQRCLIAGESDSGKTTLLQWIVARRLIVSRLIVIDPHSYPGKYPSSAKVIGMGRNYDEIERGLNALIQLMTKRYGEIGRGEVAEMAHGKITIVIDEWRAIVQNLGKAAGVAIGALLTESRKAAFSVFVATHSERVKALGIEGEGDLKDGFVIVRLSMVNGTRQATIDRGGGELAALLPGPFGIVDEDIDLEQKPTIEQSEILRLHAQGLSDTAIVEALHDGQKNARWLAEIREIIGRYK